VVLPAQQLTTLQQTLVIAPLVQTVVPQLSVAQLVPVTQDLVRIPTLSLPALTDTFAQYDLALPTTQLSQLQTALITAPLVQQVLPTLPVSQLAPVTQAIVSLPALTTPALADTFQRYDVAVPAPQLVQLQSALMTAPLVTALAPEIPFAQVAPVTADLVGLQALTPQTLTETFTKYQLEVPLAQVTQLQSALAIAPLVQSIVPQLPLTQLAPMTADIARLQTVSVSALTDTFNHYQVQLPAPEMQRLEWTLVTMPAIQPLIPTLSVTELPRFTNDLFNMQSFRAPDLQGLARRYGVELPAPQLTDLRQMVITAPLIHEAMANIQAAFASRTAHGPAWVAAFLVHAMFSAEHQRLIHPLHGDRAGVPTQQPPHVVEESANRGWIIGHGPRFHERLRFLHGRQVQWDDAAFPQCHAAPGFMEGSPQHVAHPRP